MGTQVPPTAEEATPGELRRASLRLLLMLLVLGLLVVPLIHELPLGRSTRIGLLAWLLVALALYWLYKGMGYRPLLLVQLLLFSMAATLLSAKVLLVIVDVREVNILRAAARWFVLLGTAFAGANLGGMLVRLLQQQRRP
ncbi:MAG TPA: hypothetical protein VHL81_08880 [Gemmatimonadales bacterium]|jgi:hypothetical protein|nr:hypothetical protein [Gemmatimonadales bacterium]HEX3234644.1 hypothetical protein [Gemmatimonadales bacterium]